MNKVLTGIGSLALIGSLGLALGGGAGMAGARAASDELVVQAMVGAAIGIGIALLQRHPVRSFGLIPYGALGIFVALLGLALDLGPGWCLAVLNLAAILATFPGRFVFLAPSRLMPSPKNIWFVTAGLFSVVLGKVAVDHLAGPLLTWLLVAVAGAGTVLAFLLYYREFVEQTAEVLLWPIYRIRAAGPGRARFPSEGPVLIVSNHSAWFDPIWIGKVVPRRIIPMMTSLFYDLPVMRWLMVYVIRAIRVQDSGFRREVPELDEAVKALDRGECVVIFPEGRVRRKEEQPLRQFGQGVWHILRQRPRTPVVVCWIEGGWGSYFSYLNGPPMKNKPLDRWHRILIGMRAPEVLDPAILAEHRATRAHLRSACLETRGLLGLEPYQIHLSDEKDEEEG